MPFGVAAGAAFPPGIRLGIGLPHEVLHTIAVAGPLQLFLHLAMKRIQDIEPGQGPPSALACPLIAFFIGIARDEDERGHPNSQWKKPVFCWGGWTGIGTGLNGRSPGLMSRTPLVWYR